MFVDDQTLRDLDIFPGSDGAPSILANLDNTKTKGGSAALRARFATPLRDSKSIRRVQLGLRYLMDNTVRFAVAPDLIDDVRWYLDSSWEVGTWKRRGVLILDSIWVSLKYRELLQYAKHGVQATRNLVGQVVAMIEALNQPDPPPEVAALTSELSTIVDRVGLDGVEREAKAWQILETDQRVRGSFRADLHRMIEILFELDALCAMADAALERELVFPEIVDHDDLIVEGSGVYHLLLNQPVANPISVCKGDNLVFLTGPNMSGKTTYLKSVAIAVFLAHTGMAVPARCLRLTPLDALCTSLSPEENIRAGLSFFMAEVQRVREVAELLVGGKRALVFFDELFKGTNVKDAIEASRLVLLGFCKAQRSGFVVSSHLLELADELRDTPSIRFMCLDGQIRDGEAEYGFHLRPGISDRRFGMVLLDREGVPSLLESLSRGEA